MIQQEYNIIKFSKVTRTPQKITVKEHLYARR